MFRLSVVDHVRLTFGHVVRNYTVHTRAAERLSRLAWRARFLVLALLGVATAATITSLLQPWRPYQIAAAAAAALALIGYAVYLALSIEARVHAHRSFAHRLWVICEEYRSLLAEIQDGLLDRDVVLRRRDALIRQTHAAYDHPFPVDQPAFESVRQAAQGSGSGAVTDEEIDQFLPESLRLVARPR